MSFPTTLDSTSTIPVESASTPLSTNHVTNHTASQTAIIALETKVGVDGSAVTSSHDYKLGEILTTDKAVGKSATQTLTNKTLTSPTITGATITTSTLNGVTLQTAGSATDFLAANGTYQAGAVTNASSTVKGIVELATTAEINAGTATGGTGAALVMTPDQFLASNIYRRAIASNTLTYSSDATVTAVGVGLALAKSVRILIGGEIRVKFDAQSGYATSMTFRIYRNGVAYGTLQTTTATGYVTFSEDLYFAAGDSIDLYFVTQAAPYGSVKNFRLYYDQSTDLTPITIV